MRFASTFAVFAALALGAPPPADAASLPAAGQLAMQSGMLIEVQDSLPVGQTPMPDTPKMTILIRTTIIALNHANRTNNYTVLHDMAAPGFQESNSPEQLSGHFEALRERDLDLGPVALINPQLFREPSIDQRGRLRLTGFFPSRPEQVNFDLAFELVDGDWRLFGIGVNTSREEPAQ